MGFQNPFHVQILVFHLILGVALLSSEVIGISRFQRPGNPPPVVKVGKEVVPLTIKRGSSRNGAAQTVDIAPLLSADSSERRIGMTSQKTSLQNTGKSSNPEVLVLRRKSTNPRIQSLYNGQLTTKPPSLFSSFLKQTLGLGGTNAQQQRKNNLLDRFNFNKPNPGSILGAHQQSVGISPLGKSQYHRTILPLLHDYKKQKEAADTYYAKYLKTLQLLAIATDPDSQENSKKTQSSYQTLTLSLDDSKFSKQLENATFEKFEYAEKASSISRDQETQASERSDTFHLREEPISYQQEWENQKRKILAVFPPPHSEVPFGERTILMVRFPPVPAPPKEKAPWIKLKKDYNIDGGITFGGPRWMSFGTPFDPFDHPWYHVHREPPKLVLTEADKPSGYGVIITQNFIHRPSIRFTNSDPKSLAKYKGDILDGGPSIVAHLAKALAEGNRISNAYFLSRNFLKGKTWTSQETKPPFVIIHLDTYTKKYNETDTLDLGDQVEANYANGTIIYPTLNDPDVLASTKFEFHDAHEIEHIFDRPLALVHGHGWGQEPVYPKGINEIKNFLRLMYKVHQETHDSARQKSEDLKNLGDKLTKPAFPDSKPLLRDQIADRSINWLHTSSVGIRSLSKEDDHFPYEHQPVIDVTHEYHHYV